jgi:hypothetical protein
MKLKGDGEHEPSPFTLVGYGRPAVDREARNQVLLVGDIAYPQCAAE